ncbi:MAG: hypothetical protein HC778_08975 [Chamaesiphon sp. CSU_1_12]|nr:hypothetical protein [Chamaesiphon sp. CSU_1_12]
MHPDDLAETIDIDALGLIVRRAFNLRAIEDWVADSLNFDMIAATAQTLSVAGFSRTADDFTFDWFFGANCIKFADPITCGNRISWHRDNRHCR